MVKENNFPALTGIRAIAAYMVFLHHFNPINSQGSFRFLYKIINEFHIGVTIFFVLSGFLITYRYYNNEEMKLKKYLLNRFARIYPLYFILTTLTFIFFALKTQFSIKEYVLNITFLRGFFDKLKFSGIAQGWSLTVEEFFYFTAPLFFICIRKSKISLVILPILIMLLGYAFVCYLGNALPYGFMTSNDFMLDFTFFGRCFEFFFGMALAFVIMRQNQLFKAINFTYFGAFMIVALVYWLSTLNSSGCGTEMFLGKMINTLFLPLFGIAPLLYGLIKEKTILSKVLSTSIFQLLGKSSYAFYLIHMGIFSIVINKVSTNLGFHFIVLNILAILCYSILENPLNLFIRKLVK
jgi:peptidoglycan/LPS O-acetylase OafA/YrhL